MSWTDKKSTDTIIKLRDEFSVEDFVETGTFRGTNAILYSLYFKNVYTCEINTLYYNNVKNIFPPNVFSYNMDSSYFLKFYRKIRNFRKSNNSIPIFYLDAHFYKKGCKTNEDRFVILRELKSLNGFGDCIVIIHDFDCERLGHITYDNISLNFDLVGKYLNNINSNFSYYVNTKEYCNIITQEDVKNNKIKGISPTFYVIDNLKYVWSSPEKAYRGILYCVPRKLCLSRYYLKELNK